MGEWQTPNPKLQAPEKSPIPNPNNGSTDAGSCAPGLDWNRRNQPVFAPEALGVGPLELLWS